MLKQKPILRNLLWILILVSVLFIGTLTFLHLFTRHGQDFLLPDFTGLTLQQADSVARTAQLRLEVSDSLYMPDLPKGTIFRQVPQAGEHVKKHRRIELTVNSILPRQVAMPSLVGYSLRQAKAELTGKGLTIGKLIYEPDIATNNVLDQRVKGRHIDAGTMLDLFCSVDLVLGLAADAELAYVPLLIGKSLESAKDILSDHSLNLGFVTYDVSVKTATDSLAARIYRQNPVYTNQPEWPLGTTVHLSLTLNPDLLQESTLSE